MIGHLLLLMVMRVIFDDIESRIVVEAKDFYGIEDVDQIVVALVVVVVEIELMLLLMSWMNHNNHFDL